MMSPTLPPVAAFRLLADLNAFFAVPEAERDKLLVDYMKATEEREAQAAVLLAEKEASAQDRLDASESLHQAANKVGDLIHKAGIKAKATIAAANAQAESATATALKSVGEAADKVIAAEEEAARRIAGLADREVSVKAREAEIGQRETTAQVAALDAAAEKAKYEDLINQFRDIQSRGP